jgi:hypothetical protein
VHAAWTNEIADYIKGELGAKQLVFDGIDSERLGGVAKLPEPELAARKAAMWTTTRTISTPQIRRSSSLA